MVLLHADVTITASSKQLYLRLFKKNKTKQNNLFFHIYIVTEQLRQQKQLYADGLVDAVASSATIDVFHCE